MIVGPSTSPDTLPYAANDQRIVRVETDQAFVLARLIGTPDEVKELSEQLKCYIASEESVGKIISDEDKYVPNYQPRGMTYWELLHLAINEETVRDQDRFFMYWLKTQGIEKGKPSEPTERQAKIVFDGAKTGELMAKSFVYDERIEGVLRQSNRRMVLGGRWGEGIKYTQCMPHYDTFDPRARNTYEAIVTSPTMTVPYIYKD